MVSCMEQSVNNNCFIIQWQAMPKQICTFLQGMKCGLEMKSRLRCKPTAALLCTEGTTVRENTRSCGRRTAQFWMLAAAEAQHRRSEHQRRAMLRVVCYCSALSQNVRRENILLRRFSFQTVPLAPILSRNNLVGTEITPFRRQLTCHSSETMKWPVGVASFS